jgi:hypothetical protein
MGTVYFTLSDAQVRKLTVTDKLWPIDLIVSQGH